MKLHDPTKQLIGNILKCLSFLLVFTLLLSALSYCFMPKNNDPKSSMRNFSARGFYGEPKNSLDIIAIGNSNIASDFSPMELWKQYGYTGYVCGEPSQTTFEAYTMLSEVLSCQKPKVVLLEVEGAFPLSGRMDTFNRYVNSNLKRTFPLIEYHNNWKNISVNKLAAPPRYTWTSPTQGYWFTKKVKPFDGTQHQTQSHTADNVDAITRTQMNAFLKLCKKNNAKLVLVYMPTTYNWNMRRHDQIAHYAKANGLPFIDLNTCMRDYGLDWQMDTADGVHLNYSGAKKTTRFVGAYLNRNYKLPDHRTDTSYSRWDKKYKDYEMLV